MTAGISHHSCGRIAKTEEQRDHDSAVRATTTSVDRSRFLFAADLVRGGWTQGLFFKFQDGSELPGGATIGDVLLSAKNSGKSMSYCLASAAWAAGRTSAERDALYTIVDEECRARYGVGAVVFNNRYRTRREDVVSLLNDLSR